MCNTQQASFYSTSLWLIWEKQHPERKPMLLRTVASFCVIFRSEELRPLSLFALTLRKEDDRFGSTDRSVCYWVESPSKGQYTRAGSFFCFFHVTEVVWDAFKRGLPLFQVTARAKPTTWAEKARGRWPRPDQQSARANGLSLVTRPWALIGMS